jgi:glyoxylase-like metal-dependent hydrolase (beta-lactamase superfamily II)
MHVLIVETWLTVGYSFAINTVGKMGHIKHPDWWARIGLIMSSIFMVFILVATPVLADIPGQIDSRWEPDPLQPGAQWWRDTTNQNDIVQYYNDVYNAYAWTPSVETVWEDTTNGQAIYVYRAPLSNVVALVGNTEWVLVDSLDSPTALQMAVAALRPYTNTKTLKALIYTSEDFTHYSGSSILTAHQPVVYAEADFYTSLATKSSWSNWFPYTLFINGVYLTEGADGRIAPSNTVGKFPYLYPSQLIATETTINQAGFNIDLLPAESANDADMLVWLPDQKVLVSGDAWSPAFPDIGPLNNLGCSVPDWVNTLNRMMSINPDVMVPAHGPVISSNGEINSILTSYSDAMQYVYDTTQTLISQGASQDDAAAQVHLPEPLDSDPYLQPFVNSIASAVKGIYHPGDWWFKGEPPELASTLTTARRAEIMNELGSNIDHMLTTSLNAELAANDLPSAEGSLLMAWATYQTAPDNLLADRIYIQALRKNAFMQRSNQIRNFYLSVAQTIEANMPTTPTVSSINPNSGNQGQVLNSVIINGTGFTGTTSISFGASIAVNNFNVDSDTQITASITIAADATLVARNVSVTTPEGTDTLPSGFTVLQTQQVNTATGTGTATFATSSGSMTGLASSIATGCGSSPSGSLGFPHGFFSYNITSITPGSTAIVTITLPSAMPVNTQYWKCINSQWVNVTSILGSNDGDNVLTLTLTDGGMGDADGLANGTIVDPGGPGFVITAPSATAAPVVKKPFVDSSSSPSIQPSLPARISVKYLNVQPLQTKVNQPITVYANMTNSGDESGNFTATLKINGVAEQTIAGKVGGHAAVPLNFEVIKNKPGTYNVDINGQQVYFTVIAPESGVDISRYISIIGFFVCLLGVIVVSCLLIRRRPATR